MWRKLESLCCGHSLQEMCLRPSMCSRFSKNLVQAFCVTSQLGKEQMEFLNIGIYFIMGFTFSVSQHKSQKNQSVKDVKEHE